MINVVCISVALEAEIEIDVAALAMVVLPNEVLDAFVSPFGFMHQMNSGKKMGRNFSVNENVPSNTTRKMCYLEKLIFPEGREHHRQSQEAAPDTPRLYARIITQHGGVSTNHETTNYETLPFCWRGSSTAARQFRRLYPGRPNAEVSIRLCQGR